MPILLNLSGNGEKGERQIDKEELIEMGRAYRDQRHEIIKIHGNNRNDSRACYFSKQIYDAIFASGCDGIKTYYGIRTEMVDGKEQSLHTIILVGTRKGEEALEEKDYVAIAGNSEDENVIYEWGSLCPSGRNCYAGTFLEEIDSDLRQPESEAQ